MVQGVGERIMKFTPTSIPDVILIEPEVFEDTRGFFMETFQAERFRENGIDANFVQDSQSSSYHGFLRGLHYQIKQPQGKLVRVIGGSIFDVCVDLRLYSPSFGEWVGVELSSNNKKQLWIPPGFAHGFYVFSKSAEVIYKETDYYAPQWERVLLWNDPNVGVQWPITSLFISNKDACGSTLKEAHIFNNLYWRTS